MSLMIAALYETHDEHKHIFTLALVVCADID